MLNNISEKYTRNETIIRQCFQENPGFLGIDGIDIKFETEVTIVDSISITTFADNFFELDINSSYNKNGRIKEIEILSPNFGKIVFRFNNSNFDMKCKCFVRLILGDLNVKTSTMKQIMSKLKNVLTCITIFSNIDIIHPTEEDIIIQGIEIAYTFSTLEKISYQTRLLLLRIFSKVEQPNKSRYVGIEDDPFDHHIISAKLGYNYSIVLYDKSAKAQSDNHLENIKNHGYRIYRLEFVIKRGKITELLGSRILSDITDETIKNFFNEQINLAVINLIHEIKKSVQLTDKTLNYYFKEFGNRDYIHRFFSGILTPALEKSMAIALDEEIFCHLKLPFIKSPKNKSRIRRQLINECIIQSKDKKYILSKMITWQTLIILKIMNCYIYCDEIQSTTANQNFNDVGMKVISLKPFNNKTRIAIYNDLLSSRTKSTTIEKIILDRWKKIDHKKYIIYKITE
ncbi:hypothetical protein [Streptococcus suis]|uniref:hypothetical protein n=1 Tax=Streptococcus suis TaxID=1307 RepID=UPI0005CE05AC|nr:hypothetical protein [Streptococcus suis]NQH79834.1 hypothetical protein [Streptococcus suis]CYU60911.1 Uncharacterised protein [Streptococcus suis]